MVDSCALGIVQVEIHHRCTPTIDVEGFRIERQAYPVMYSGCVGPGVTTLKTQLGAKVRSGVDEMRVSIERTP